MAGSTAAKIKRARVYVTQLEKASFAAADREECLLQAQLLESKAKTLVLRFKDPVYSVRPAVAKKTTKKKTKKAARR